MLSTERQQLMSGRHRVTVQSRERLNSLHRGRYGGMFEGNDFSRRKATLIDVLQNAQRNVKLITRSNGGVIKVQKRHKSSLLLIFCAGYRTLSIGRIRGVDHDRLPCYAGRFALRLTCLQSLRQTRLRQRTRSNVIQRQSHNCKHFLTHLFSIVQGSFRKRKISLHSVADRSTDQVLASVLLP
jgi:hypothetical protein